MKELERAVLAVMLGKKEEQVDETVKHPNQQKLDVHEPEKDKLTAKDFEMLRAGKKAKEVKENLEKVAEQVKPEVEKAFPASGVTKHSPMKGASTMPKDKEKRGPVPAGSSMKEEAEDIEGVDLEEEADETIIVKPLEVEVKESYNFGEYLQTAKNLVGEDQAIEIANEAFRLQDKSIFVAESTKTDIEQRVKTHQTAGHKVSMPKYSTRDGKPHAEYIVTDKDSGVRRKYIHHGSMRKVENMGTRGKKDE